MKVLSIIGDKLLYSDLNAVIQIAGQSHIVYITGDNINILSKNKWNIDTIHGYCNNIVFSIDGFGHIYPKEPNDNPIYINNIKYKSSNIDVCDIGPKSLVQLKNLIKTCDKVNIYGKIGNDECYGSTLFGLLGQ